MESWLFNNKEITQDFPIEHFYSFVYLMTHKKSGKLYIGRKCLFHKKWTKKKQFKLVESDWFDYFSSSKHIKRVIIEEGKTAFRREILEFFTTSRESFDKEKEMLFQVRDWEKFYNSYLCLQHYKTPPFFSRKKKKKK